MLRQSELDPVDPLGPILVSIGLASESDFRAESPQPPAQGGRHASHCVTIRGDVVVFFFCRGFMLFVLIFVLLFFFSGVLNFFFVVYFFISWCGFICIDFCGFVFFFYERGKWRYTLKPLCSQQCGTERLKGSPQLIPHYAEKRQPLGRTTADKNSRLVDDYINNFF